MMIFLFSLLMMVTIIGGFGIAYGLFLLGNYVFQWGRFYTELWLDEHEKSFEALKVAAEYQ